MLAKYDKMIFGDISRRGFSASLAAMPALHEPARRPAPSNSAIMRHSRLATQRREREGLPRFGSRLRAARRQCTCARPDAFHGITAFSYARPLYLLSAAMLFATEAIRLLS